MLLKHILSRKMQKDQKVYAKENDVYFRKQSETPDGAEKMKSGEELVVVDGPWWRVAKNGVQGWVRADYISETVQTSPSVKDFVQFVKGQAHLAASEITKKVREAIKDEFGLGKSGDNLNCTEYVMYQVKTKTDVLIKWPADRPRNGGKWADIFERNKLYTVLSEPQVNCAMCFTTGISSDSKINDVGHVAFVEEVLADGSIKISEANWPNQGKYNERPVSKADWQNKYKARFVKFV